MLYEFCEKGEWEKAIRLCRFVKDSTLWACLAALSTDGNELNTAEEAFAAIEAIDKLQFVSHIKRVPSREGRNAELLLFKGQSKEAETLLLQSGNRKDSHSNFQRVSVQGNQIEHSVVQMGKVLHLSEKKLMHLGLWKLQRRKECI
jgi:hypothetical protein